MNYVNDENRPGPGMMGNTTRLKSPTAIKSMSAALTES